MLLDVTHNASSYTVELNTDRGTIGRGPKATIRIPFSTISSSHLEFERRGETYYVRDLQSTNGTRLNEKKIPPMEWVKIAGDTEFKIVGTRLVFRPTAKVAANFTLAQSGTLARKLLFDALQNTDDAYIEVLNGAEKGKKIFLSDDAEKLVFGSRCRSIKFPPSAHPQIAELIIEGDGFSIHVFEDIQSNGTRVSGGKMLRLTNNQILEISSFQFRFVDPLEAYFEQLDGGKESLDEPTETEIQIERKEPETAEETPYIKMDMAPESQKSATSIGNRPQKDLAIQKEHTHNREVTKDWILAAVIVSIIVIGITIAALILML